MALQKKDREFRLPKISYLDFKTIEMDGCSRACSSG
jgi:hypothetical protein